MGAPDIRWLTKRAVTTSSWPDMASGSAVLANTMAWLDPWASITTGASGSRASNGSVTAGRGS